MVIAMMLLGGIAMVVAQVIAMVLLGGCYDDCYGVAMVLLGGC